MRYCLAQELVTMAALGEALHALRVCSAAQVEVALTNLLALYQKLNAFYVKR